MYGGALSNWVVRVVVRDVSRESSSGSSPGGGVVSFGISGAGGGDGKAGTTGGGSIFGDEDSSWLKLGGGETPKLLP